MQPIIGCQLGDRAARSEASAAAANRPVAKPTPDQLVLLVQNEAGYRNLLRLVSRAYLEGEPGEAPQLPTGGARRPQRRADRA